ncbi:cadherin-23 [Biomphalaria glabrata]|nr:cadherin-23 [Biomphalaria glabrata]
MDSENFILVCLSVPIERGSFEVVAFPVNGLTGLFSVIRVESRFKTAAYSLINATILLTDVNDNPSVILHLDGHQNKLHLNVSEGSKMGTNMPGLDYQTESLDK